MNRKQLVILLVFVVVLGAAGLYLQQQNQSSWKTPDKSVGQKLLGDLPINDVAHIDIKTGTNELDLVRKDNLWRVRQRNDYPANFSDISDFLIKARDVKIVQSEKVGPSGLARLELVPGNGTNSALVVNFDDQNGKTIRSLLLGKKHMRKSTGPSPYGMGDDQGWPDGRYVMVGANSGNAALISEAFANIEPKPEQWLNKDFVKVEKIRSIAVQFPNPTNSWKLTRETETGEWKLADAKSGEQLDTSKASGVASPLASPSFNDVAPAAKPGAIGLDKPTQVTVDTFDNFVYTLKVGQKTNDNYPITLAVSATIPKERTPGKDEKAADKTRLDKEFQDKIKKLEDKLAQEKTYEPWVYMVSTWSLDSLLKDRSQLLVEKKAEPKTENKAASPTASSAHPVQIPPGLKAMAHPPIPAKTSAAAK